MAFKFDAHMQVNLHLVFDIEAETQEEEAKKIWELMRAFENGTETFRLDDPRYRVIPTSVGTLGISDRQEGFRPALS